MDTGEAATGWSELWGELIEAFDFLSSGLFSLLWQPWGQIQIITLLVVLGVTFLIARRIEPVFEKWVRGLETNRRTMRAYAILLRRLHLVFFCASTWAIWLVMRMTTWPSRSYLIGVVASIATVWLATSLISKLVKSPLVARLLTVSVVVLVALQILGAIPIAASVLDAAALSAGEFRISLLTVVKTIFILSVLLTISQMISGFTETRLQSLDEISPSMRVLAGKLVRVGLFTIAIVLGLQSVGLDLTTLTVFSGAIGLGLGFGLQKVVSNLVSGVILLLDKSVKPGDVIEVGDTFGWISKLGARFVSVVTRDGREYLIPNEDLITNQVVNWSHTNPRVRLEVEFGVSYESDPLTVRKVAIEAAGQPKRVLGVPAPVCHLKGYGDSSVDYVLRFWISDPSDGVINIKSDVLIALWYGLKQNGIGIPYPRRDITIIKPVAVTSQADETPVAAKRSRPRSKAPKPAAKSP
ncbi:mechanosensitive ion channel domain-containing protein [Devosia neptuniae]|uniref:mechanosensitive ion channel family protein n=1 Tax=Devosia TaxID=46913 RepID=UPI0022AF4E64|nr:mechanosensitive ion channel domain-containing protein [Devosia neptuniae]MCZ4344730.1 mechanosensitive ion channel [Devosia neptuniae]